MGLSPSPPFPLKLLLPLTTTQQNTQFKTFFYSNQQSKEVDIHKRAELLKPLMQKEENETKKTQL